MAGPGGASAFSSVEQLRLMMAVYGLGFIAVFVVFALLYRHATAARGRLGLGERAVLEAEEGVGEGLVMIAVALLSVGVAQLVPARWAPPVAGFVYFLIGPRQYVNGRYHDRRQRRIIESVSDATGYTDQGVDRDSRRH